MVEQVVTELVIDARPASAGEREFSSAMQSAAASAEKAKAAALGLAPAGSRLAAAFDRVRASADPVYAVTSKLERQLGTLDSAFRRGVATEQQVADIRGRLYARQAAQLDQLAQAQRRVALGGAENFNSANVAAQLQDVFVTASMGMNPFQIALQQGTQLSAVLGPQGLTGVVRTLGSAFLSLINPVSLLTIGAVALGATAIQALSSIIPKAESATDAIKRHGEALGMIVDGYDHAEKAVADFVQTASIKPRGVAEIELAAQFKQMTADVEAFRSKSELMGPALAGSLNVIDREVSDLLTGFNAGQRSAGSLAVELTRIANSDLGPLGFTIKGMVVDLADGAIKATMLRDALVAMSHVAAGLGHNEGLQVALDSKIEATRSAQAHQIEMDAIKAKTPAQMADIARRRESLKLQDDEITDALRRQKIEEAGSLAYAQAAATRAAAGQKLTDAYADLVAGVNRRIAQAEIEAQALGMTEAAAARLRIQHELLSSAQQAGITLDRDKRNELTLLANRLADAEMRTKELTKAQEDQQRQTQVAVDALAGALGTLFAKPITDAREFFGTVLGGFAQLGQSNLKASLQNLFNPTANDNGGAGGWANAWDKVGKAVQKGAQDGTKGGFADLVRNIPGGAGGLSAGLGGLGIGYQTQNPLMGALGGALSGAAAGPWGIALGAIGGLVGGLFGMNEALEKARKEVESNRQAIEQFIATGLGTEISKYSSALASFNQQGAKLVELAKAAGDSSLVSQINAAMQAYRSTLGVQFRQELDSSVNSLRGQGYLNEVADAQKRYNQRLSDAAMLGVSAAGASEELTLALRKIVNDADLTAAQLTQLAGAFPGLEYAISQAIGSLQLKRAQASVDTARQTLREAYEREASALNDVIERNKQFIASIEQFKTALLLDNSLSIMSPLDRLAVAQSRFSTVSAAAISGDAAAQAQLEQAARDYLQLARGAYASSQQYVDIFAQVQGVLDQALAGSSGAKSNAEQQLDQIKTQTGLLIDLNTNVATVADSIFQLNMALVSLAAAQASSGGFVLGGRIPGYAWGGIVSNGKWNRDSVLARYAGGGAIALAGGEHVTRAPAVNRRTLPTLDFINRTGRVPSNDDNAGVVSALRSIEARLASLESTTAAGAQHVREGVDQGSEQLSEVNRRLRAAEVRR